jgi:hypothetical protein
MHPQACGSFTGLRTHSLRQPEGFQTRFRLRVGTRGLGRRANRGVRSSRSSGELLWFRLPAGGARARGAAARRCSGHIAAAHVFEVASAEDHQPVETLVTDGAHEPLRVGVRLWRPDRCVNRLDSFAAEHFVEGGAELVSRSWIRKHVRSTAPVKLRLRACCVTHAPVGLLVQSARCTRRLPSSMKKRT